MRSRQQLHRHKEFFCFVRNSPRQRKQLPWLVLFWDSSAAFAVDLDFSLPSYDAKMSGSGEGTDAVSTGKTDSLTDPGANEKTKQTETAMNAAIALKEKE